MTAIRDRYNALCALGLKLDLTRGQPGDDNFDLSNAMLTIVDDRQLMTDSRVAIRNYPGGVTGLAEARALLAPVLGVLPEETLVGNNASLALMSNVLMWAMLKGLRHSPAPWSRGPIKFIVTVPGYDRHFTMLEKLGIEMIPVRMTGAGPDMGEVERIAAGDPSVKGFFVPTYSNPTGETLSAGAAARLAGMQPAAVDFTILADDAYAVHHLIDNPATAPNLLAACKSAGNPDRVILFGSTSKVTFAGAGLGFLGASVDNIAYLTDLFEPTRSHPQPGKPEQWSMCSSCGASRGGLGV